MSYTYILTAYTAVQYGLKSIAVKNLANLAAGVRKEADNNVKLSLFGRLAGILEPDDFQDGKCDMMMEGLKALFPTDQIKERLEGSPELPISSLAFATLASFTSKYYFTDEDDLAQVWTKPIHTRCDITYIQCCDIVNSNVHTL